jgi:hypothetical protein
MALDVESKTRREREREKEIEGEIKRGRERRRERERERLNGFSARSFCFGLSFPENLTNLYSLAWG